MKVSAFKQLIIEAAKEGVIQGLQEMLGGNNIPIKEQREISFTTNDVPNVQNIRKNLYEKLGGVFNGEESRPDLQVKPGENAYLAFLNDTAANMTFQDKQGISNLGETY